MDIIRTSASHLSEHATLYVGAVSSLLLYAVYKAILYPRFFSPMRSYPGPQTHWLFGNVFDILGSEPGRSYMEWHKQYGPVIRTIAPFPGYENISFTSYSALKTILVDRAYDFPKPSYLRDLLGIAAGYGLLTLEGSEHQELRRWMNPAFRLNFLHEREAHGRTKQREVQGTDHNTPVTRTDFDIYHKPISSLVDIVSNDIKSNESKDGKVFEVTKLINSCLMDIICLTAFGYECDSLHNEDQPLANAYHSLVNLQNLPNLLTFFGVVTLPGGARIAKSAVRSSWVGPLLTRLNDLTGNTFLGPIASFVRNMRQVNVISQQLLNEKLSEAHQLQKAGNSLDGGKIDVLSLMVKASLDNDSPYKMDGEALSSQMLTFLGAGHETTASGAAWALWELASHRSIQEKLRKECQELIARNSTPGYQDIKHLRYLNNFVQEVMRLRPPTPQTARQAAKDSMVDGVFVPKGTGVFIASRVVNEDEKIWGSDAHEFNPDRWDALPEKYDSTFSMLTFIAGPHHCIGRNMAIMELKALLCVLVANFDFTPAQATPKETSAITMKPEGGLYLRLKRLNPADVLTQQ